MSKNTVCIYDGEKVRKGYKIKEDFIIRLIKRLKQRFGSYKGNTLVVCEKHIEEHRKRRKRFEKNMGLLGGVFALLGLLYLISLISNFSLGKLVSFTIFIAILGLIFILLFILSYVPSVEEGKNKEKRVRVKKK